MKKTIILYIFLICILCCLCSGRSDKDIFAPDGLYTFGEGNIYIANRGSNELLLYKGDLQSADKIITLASPVNDLTIASDNRMWAVCDGYLGKLYELGMADLKVLSETEIGNSPSAVRYNALTKSLWITQRFKNKILEINPANKKTISAIEVGREPVDMISFESDSFLLVVNNLPEMSSLDFPVAAQLSVVDVLTKQVVKRIMLPNGSTDVKSVTISGDGSYAYVTHLVARYQLPTNQVDRGWMSTNALSIIELRSKEVINTILLDTPQKGSANPWGVTMSADNKSIIVAASGVDELVVIDRKALHNRLDKAKNGIFETPSTNKWENIPNDAGFLYGIAKYISTGGKGPRAVTSAGGKVYAANYFTGEIVTLDLPTGEKKINTSQRASLSSTTEGKGNMYFHDATLGFQGWQSCASCHPNDARADGLNWDLMNDGIGNPKNTKTLLLSHQTPPCMITGIRKNANVAVRSGLKYILFAEANEEVCTAIDAYLISLSPETSPYLVKGKLSKAAKKGKTIFDNHCASCHSGPYYTDGKQYEISWSHGSEKNVKMDVPALNEVWRTAPYLYDGRSSSMKEMLKIHGPKVPISEKELDELSEYILSL